MNDRVRACVAEIVDELEIATKIFGPFCSAHEGYAIMKEEYDELWDEIKRNPRDRIAMRREATQLAAMAIRFMVDCCD